MTGYIHSIETFGTVDGPGVRYVVFMQGCPLRCAYCHNPDTWEPSTGSQKSVKDILLDYEKYKPYLKSGGLTVTGGEPLLQIDFVISLFEAAKEKGIHTCLDTSGITFNPDSPAVIEKFDKLLMVTDLIMLDIKHIDEQEHQKLTGHGNKNILAFARYLAKKDAALWVRHVVVPDITFNKEYLKQLGYFLGELPNLKALDVLPYHNMGISKYEKLKIPYPLKETKPLSKEDAVTAKKIILKARREKILGKNA